MFKLEHLPKDVREKIDSIEFNSFNYAHIIGFVYLKDEWVFSWDYSHVTSFTSRQDLINMVRYGAINE